MNIIDISANSKAFNKELIFTAIIPTSDKDTRFKTLYFLHGMGEDGRTLSKCTSICDWAQKRKVAVILPSVLNSFYTNTSTRQPYWTYAAEELPRLVQSIFPISTKKEDTCVAGVSMGGYGAFKFALRRPEMFKAACSLSGSLDIIYDWGQAAKGLVEIPKSERDMLKWVFESHFYTVFGNPSKSQETDEDIRGLLKRASERDTSLLPKLYSYNGNQDEIVYRQPQIICEYAKGLGIDIEEHNTDGTHEYSYWANILEYALDRLFEFST